jgi:two-component system, chemotaxis family, protein-glutamate methylesterase/glutaminase
LNNSIPKQKIKLLIVDDSSLMRDVLVEIFSSDPGIEIIGAAANPFAAVKIIKDEVPDVITLDIQMPGMDGLTFLEKIMTQHPIPVVVFASINHTNSDTILKAMDCGAVDVMAKPQYVDKQSIKELKILLCDAVKAASLVQFSTEKVNRPVARVEVNGVHPSQPARGKVIAIGASTGGPQALQALLEKMTIDSPGIVIVQHMHSTFTKLFAERLNSLCDIEVKEAEQNDQVKNGQALIAPGNKHMVLRKSANRYFVDLTDGALVRRHRPSVDVLFESVARSAGKDAIGILMTGMGNDGAAGLLKMKEAGAITIAQDKNSSAVFGMPKEAIEANAASKILSLNEILNYLVDVR